MKPSSWFKTQNNTEIAAPTAPEPQLAAAPSVVQAVAAPEGAANPTAPAPENPVSDTPTAPSVSVSAPDAPASVLRASRLVEGGRGSSAKLKAKMKSALANPQPWAMPAGVAAIVVAAGALGYAGGIGSGQRADAEIIAASRWAEAAAGIRESREDTARLAAEMRFMRTALDGLRAERGRSDINGKQAQLSDKVERYTAESTAKFAKLAEALDRIEKTQRDPARLGAVVERLERIEKQVQTAAVTPPAAAAPKPVAAVMPPAPAQDVAQTGSLAEPRPPARPAEVDQRKVQVEGYTVRDVEDGFALVEGRNGRFFEVTQGTNLPGLGKVEAIERRGRQWVVVTPKGYVGER